MCNKAVDASLFSNWFVTNKMIKKLNDNTIFVNEDSGNVTFSSVDLNNVNLNDPETIIYALA